MSGGMTDLVVQKAFTSATRMSSLDITVRLNSRRVVLYGPSGAGKSLTLRTITDLTMSECGRTMLDGRTLLNRVDGINLSAQERRVGYLFQDYALSNRLTVAQNIAFGPKRGRFNPLRCTHDSRIQQWVDAFELGSIATNFPTQISGGQYQCVALARTLIAEPSMLLPDGSSVALNLVLCMHMRSELSALQARLQVPMLMITHDLADVEIFGDRVFRLCNGRVVTGAVRAPDVPSLSPYPYLVTVMNR